MLLEDNGVGEDWARVVELWWKLEESAGFESSTKTLPTAGRPKQVSEWVKNARKGILKVKIESFAVQWWKWWATINPSWRRVVDGKLVKEGEGPWASLKCPGQNGLLNVLACLKWWGAALNGVSGEWLEAVKDVGWALEQMR
ncbi:hypothetical protein K438DRAFT_1589591 [Mycena galopus ATCC 62051]|nr:hypothetical protein K438DRAFT_1589591 [Mycena galopus ATCC 62051]